jgi:hypothetical protein
MALGSRASCNRMSATAASKPFELPGNQGMVVCLSGRPADAGTPDTGRR